IESVPDSRASLVDTIKMFIDENPGELRETMRLADFVVVNHIEARQLAQTPSVAPAARSLLRDGVNNILIKLGEYGAAFADTQDYFSATAYPLGAVVDPTGAGVAFAGGFMGYLDTAETVTTVEIR